MGNAILYHMPSGFAGDVTRMQFSKIEAQMMDATAYTPAAYGVPVKMTSGLIRKIASNSDAIYGWLVRPYPYHGDVDANSALGGGVPPAASPCDILRTGYMAVKLTFGTAVRGATAYVVNTANGSTGIPNYGSAAVGDIVDTATYSSLGGTSADAFPCGIFMGPVDPLNSAAGIVEIAFNTGPSGIGT